MLLKKLQKAHASAAVAQECMWNEGEILLLLKVLGGRQAQEGILICSAVALR